MQKATFLMRIGRRVFQYLFVRKVFESLHQFLYKVSLHGLGILNYDGAYASGESHFISTYVSKLKKGVIFDVGANVGEYSKALRAANESIDIYSFEPHPTTFRTLRTTSITHRLRAFNVGIGRECGKFKLYDYAAADGSPHASLYKDVITTIHGSPATEHQVDIVTLAEFARDNFVEHVALLKIDTEGHELEVLQGFERYIKAGKVEIIHFEFNEMNVISKVFFRDFWDFLPNYDFYRMLPNGLAHIPKYSPTMCEIFAFQNIVAILKSAP